MASHLTELLKNLEITRNGHFVFYPEGTVEIIFWLDA